MFLCWNFLWTNCDVNHLDFACDDEWLWSFNLINNSKPRSWRRSSSSSNEPMTRELSSPAQVEYTGNRETQYFVGTKEFILFSKNMYNNILRRRITSRHVNFNTMFIQATMGCEFSQLNYSSSHYYKGTKQQTACYYNCTHIILIMVMRNGKQIDI